MTNWKEIICKGFESKELDYKGPCAWSTKDDKKACCEIVKDILALANTEGGWLVFGVSEEDSVFTWDGLSQEQAASFESTKVNNFLQNYADPPINTKTINVTYDKKMFVIIEVPRFPDTPHVCQKDYPDVLSAATIYVRTDNNESAPLKASSDMRGIVEAAIRNRSDQLLSSFRAILINGYQEPNPSNQVPYDSQIGAAIESCDKVNRHLSKQYGYREAIFYPATYMSDRFDIAELKPIAQHASVDFVGWPFIFISPSRSDIIHTIEDGIQTLLLEQQEKDGRDALHFWQLRQSGLFYKKELPFEDALCMQKGNDPILDFLIFSQNVAEAIFCLVRLYEDHLDPNEDVVFELRLSGLNGRVLGASDPSIPFSFPYACKIDNINHKQINPLADWKAGLIDHAVEICRQVFLRFNWEQPNLQACRKHIENMLARRM